MRTVRITCCAVALAAMFVAAPRAQDFNGYTKMSYLTFSGPVGLPNVTLPAGTYRFQIANPDTGRKVILVTNREGTKPFGMFLTIPNDRLAPPDWSNPVIMFREAPAGAPEAIRAWFYAGEKLGYEFVYPQDQAMKIAQASHERVLSTADDAARPTAVAAGQDRYAAINKVQVGRIDDAGRITRFEDQPVPELVPTTPAPGPVAVATAGQTAASARPRELPRTASGLGVIQLLSGLFIAAGFGVRKLRQRYTEGA